MYRRPTTAGVRLKVAPVLESWNAHNHPDQLRLSTFLDAVEASLSLPPEDEHLALELQVGLPRTRSLTSGGGDLDNYLFPIARRLGPARLDAVFGVKRHSPDSILVAGSAMTRSSRVPDMTVRTSTSATSRAWKSQIRQACSRSVPATPLGGAISLDVEFQLSPARNWAALWKPTIDSLGPLLGVPDPRRPFTPNDDRIVRLGLHRAIDASLGWDIVLNVWWAAADSDRELP